MRNYLCPLMLLLLFLFSFLAVATAADEPGEPRMQASDSVEIKVIIGEWCEVKFWRGEQGQEPDLEIRLAPETDAEGFGVKAVWVEANFTHNIETTVLDSSDDGVKLEKMLGTPDFTSMPPGGKSYNVVVKAVNESRKQAGVIAAGVVMVTVTKAL